MCWKHFLHRRQIRITCPLAILVWGCFHSVPAQQPNAPIQQEQRKITSNNQVSVVSNGSPVPFATVQNIRTGEAAVANALGLANLSAWGLQDTLRVQSMGFEVVSIVPGVQPSVLVELPVSTIEIEEVVVQSNTSVSRATTMAAVSQMATIATQTPVVTVETTGDLLQHSGQVHLQMSQQGGVSPVLRGFEANRVLLVVDGVRMNNAIYRSGHLQNAGSIDPFAIAQTQVVMGPSSVMYGSDALGGVVHFLTRRPALSAGGFDVSGKVLGQGSSVNGGWAGHANLMLRAPNWGAVTNVSRREFGDLRMGSRRLHGDSTWGKVPFLVERINERDTLMINPNPERQVPSGFSQLDLQQRFRVRAGGFDVDLNLQHSTTSDVPRFDVFNDLSGGIQKWAEWSYGPQNRTLVAATVSHSLGARSVWTTVGSFQAVEESRIKRRFGNDVRITQLEKLDVWGLSSFLRGQVRQWRWEVGIDGQWNDVKSTAQGEQLTSGELTRELTRYADGGSTMQTLGVFASARRSKGIHSIQTGLRYSHAAVHSTFLDTAWFQLPVQDVEQSDGALTGSASWSTEWSPHWRTMTSLASGFRHPNVDDLGKIREKNGFVLVPNVDLAPEMLYTAEEGLTWSLKPNSDLLRVQAAAFGSLWRDAIVQADATLNGDTVLVIDGDTARIQMNQNLDRAWVRGARIEVTGKLWPKTSLRAVCNWTLGTSLDDDETPLSHMPPTFGMVELSRKGEIARISASLQYALAKDAEDFGPGSTDNLQEALSTGTPGWSTFNIEAALQLTDRMDFRLSALNLLDVHYRTFGSGISAPGRNFRGTLSARF